MVHLIALLVVSVAPQLALDPDLARIRADFAKVPEATSELALESLIANKNDDGARLWLGTLRYEHHDYPGAAALFGAVHDPTLASLARRGLGDVAFSRRRFRTAEALYGSALDGAPPALHVELEAKRASSHRQANRSVIAYAGFAFYLLALATLLMRLRVARTWPREVTFLTPIYTLFVLGALGHGADTLEGVAAIAIGSLLSVGCLCASPTRGAIATTLTVLANAALAYAALWTSGLLALV